MNHLSQTLRDLWPRTVRQVVLFAVAAVLICLGAYFRLAGLSETSMHGDAVFHDFCRHGVSVSDLFTRWAEVIGPSSGQMPPAAALTKWFLDVFHLPPSRQNVILPSALWGIATLPVAMWVGWRLGGSLYALILMGIVALNPVHVNLSRMAYFYHPCILGSFVALWCMLESWESVVQRRGLTWRFHVAHIPATILLLYATAGAWVFAGLVALFHLTCAAINAFKHGKGWRDLSLLVGTYLAIGTPLLIVPWGVPALLQMSGSNETTAYWRRIFEVGRREPVFRQVGYAFLSFGWGWTFWREVFGVGVMASGVATTLVLARRKKDWLLPFGVFIVGLTLLVLAIKLAVWPFGLRRVSALWPAWFILLAAGLYGFWLAAGTTRRFRFLRRAGLVPALVACGLWMHADLLITRARGLPIPYRQIGQWVDSHFPKGTPMVTDRFYTAMCEFNQSDPTTNVVVISTVPNELPETQERTRFREVTRQYLEDNPDAIFYCSGHMYERPEIVPWDWPARYFKRSRIMRDLAAERLGNIGQAFWEAPATIRWPVLYYNTADDVAAMKRAKGEPAFVLYGPDWRPVQTQDYQLWRLLLSGDATLRVYGVSDVAKDVSLELSGVAAGGELRVRVAEQSVTFPPNQVVRHQCLITVQPGMNAVPIRSRGVANARLLIGRITTGAP